MHSPVDSPLVVAARLLGGAPSTISRCGLGSGIMRGMATFVPNETELAALTRLFDQAEGFGGGAQRARALSTSLWAGLT